MNRGLLLPQSQQAFCRMRIRTRDGFVVGPHLIADVGWKAHFRSGHDSEPALPEKMVHVALVLKSSFPVDSAGKS